MSDKTDINTQPPIIKKAGYNPFFCGINYPYISACERIARRKKRHSDLLWTCLLALSIALLIWLIMEVNAR